MGKVPGCYRVSSIRADLGIVGSAFVDGLLLKGS